MPSQTPIADEYAATRAPIPDTLTIAQAAVYLSISPTTVRARLLDGSLPGWRLGKRWLISRRVLDMRLAAESRDRQSTTVSAAALSGKEG